MPTFLVHDEFFVLSFENVGEDEEFGLKASRLKRRKAERCKKQCKAREIIMPEEMDKENQDPNERINQKPIQKVVNDSEILRPMNNSNRNAQIATEENSNGGKKRSEKEANVGPAAIKVETECNLENSSPISVLEYGESIVDHHKDPTSDKANSRRNLSAELDHYGHSPPCKTSSSTGDVQ